MVRGRISLAPPTAHPFSSITRLCTRMKFKSSHRSLIVYLIIATALQLSYEAECKHYLSIQTALGDHGPAISGQNDLLDTSYLNGLASLCYICSLNTYLSDLACIQGEVQLVGGRVEVCHGDDGKWKTVCDRGWREQEAKVVCRQLNHSDPLSEWLCQSHYLNIMPVS